MPPSSSHLRLTWTKWFLYHRLLRLLLRPSLFLSWIIFNLSITILTIILSIIIITIIISSLFNTIPQQLTKPLPLPKIDLFTTPPTRVGFALASELPLLMLSSTVIVPNRQASALDWPSSIYCPPPASVPKDTSRPVSGILLPGWFWLSRHPSLIGHLDLSPLITLHPLIVLPHLFHTDLTSPRPFNSTPDLT